MNDPEGVLGQIVAAKRAELSSRFAAVNLDALRSAARPARRSLAAAIARPGARFILEIKRASPSGGALRSGADAAELARGYEGVADALSVLTDGRFFGGSLGDLQAVGQHFNGPILAKDFFLDPRQVVEARLAGADAVLVMLSVLDDSDARAIIREARRLGMDALVEVHDEQEMRRALALGAPLIGVNNRDLRDLSIDLSTTERLASLAHDRLVVSESGIVGRSDVERLAGRVDGFLVGSSLMRAERPAEAARALLFGRVKLCGVNRPEDIAAAAPATFAGMVLVPGTPRCVSVERAAALAGAARRRGMLPVGIFRNEPLASVVELASTLNLHAVQLHGREDVEYVLRMRRELGGNCEIWTSVSVGCEPLTRRGGDRLLFDNGAGGTGRCFDWQVIRAHPALAQALVAGGIGPANVRSAAELGAYALDVGSAVDALPGVKSSAKIRSLFEELRPQCRYEVQQCA